MVAKRLLQCRERGFPGAVTGGDVVNSIRARELSQMLEEAVRGALRALKAPGNL